MAVQNYSLLYNHKQKIVIPYTHFQVDGKIFFIMIILVSIISGAILYFITSLFTNSELKYIIPLGTAVLTFIGIIIAIQTTSEVSGNLVVLDKIYKHVFKIPTVYNYKNEASLLTKGKIDLTNLIDYSKWR